MAFIFRVKIALSPPLHFFALDNFGLFQVSSTMEKDAETVGSGEVSFQIAQRSSILKICVVFSDSDFF